MLGDKEGQADMVEKKVISNKKVINLPLTDENALSLKAGDFVLLNGTIVTGRDRVHK